MRKIIGFVFWAIALQVNAQPLQLDMNVFEKRRQAFVEEMQPDAVAVFPCKPVYNRNLDVDYGYRQESNFYYLTGFEEPESILFLDPSAPKHKYVLFVRKRDRRRETYDGPRAGVEGAVSTFKADTAYYYDDFRSKLWPLFKFDRPIYYTFGINPELDDLMQKAFIERRAGGLWPIIDPAPIVNARRQIKTEGDLAMGMRKTVDISSLGFLEAIKSIAPGRYEYEIQAVFEYVYRSNGSPRNGYPCIVGSGPNSTILHYNKNDRQMQSGEMILMDCGAEYGYYSADITRSVPVNGKFTQEQRDIYEIVLRAQQAAIDAVKPGVKKSQLDDIIDNILGEGLVQLGFIRDKKDFRMFSLHGYAHWLGLEVHDVGAYSKKGESVILQEGMCFTVEPGLYTRPDVFEKMQEAGYSKSEISTIRKKVEKYMNIGVRIEDDILVTKDGYENLSAAVPREIEALERLMSEQGMLDLTMAH